MKLSSNALKWIAMAAMLIDHTGLVILQYWLEYGGGGGAPGNFLWTVNPETLGYVAYGMRILGRAAFPIYGFLLTEGFLHTRDWRKYCLRMIVFAAVSEIPFSLAVYNGWIGGSRNIYVELAAGLVMLHGFKKAEAYYDARQHIYMALVLAAACGFTWLINSDYGADGMLMIAAFYLLRRNRTARVAGGCLVSFSDTLGGGMGAGALAAVPLLMYSGEKGRQGNKYIFYWFYPLHLLVLFLIRLFVLHIPMM